MSEQKLKSRVMSAEESSRRLADELEVQQRSVTMIEAEKVTRQPPDVYSQSFWMICPRLT